MKFSSVLLISLLIFFLSGCSTPPNVPDLNQHIRTQAVSPKDVGAKIWVNFASFAPSKVRIQAGQAVEWIWDDSLETDQVIIQGLAKSPIQDSGEYFYVFKSPGTYKFYSPFHYKMTGVVIVTP